jgi:hypothetical protein
MMSRRYIDAIVSQRQIWRNAGVFAISDWVVIKRDIIHIQTRAALQKLTDRVWEMKVVILNKVHYVFVRIGNRSLQSHSERIRIPNSV